MNLRNILNFLEAGFGSKPESDPFAGPHCPDESDILNYLEHAGSSRKRARLQAHFANCDDCRESLVLFAQVSGEHDSIEAPPTEEVVQNQAARVLAFIKEDEIIQAADKAHGERAFAGPRIFISYAKLAAFAFIFTISIAVVYWVTMSSPRVEAMEAITLAMKQERLIEPQVSGEFPYSRYGATRGAEETDRNQLARALSKMRFAEDPSASPEDRLVLARAYLARGSRSDAERALEILQEIAAGGLRTPEVFNDTGVARFLLRDYSQAIAEFNKALANSPDYDEALFNRGLAYKQVGRIEEARQDWQRFLNLPTDEKWKDEVRNNLSKL